MVGYGFYNKGLILLNLGWVGVRTKLAPPIYSSTNSILPM